jgi:mannitol-specific phosphotransferase system IIBC component
VVASLALLIIASVVMSNTVRYRHDKKHLREAIAAQRTELQRTKLQLEEAQHLLASAEKKLSFLNLQKTTVQVTAFTGEGSFASGLATAKSYAVPHHTLPEDKVLNIALSPVARRNLHARLNDYIVLLDNHQQKTRLARFVDTTSANEQRPVVDVLFALHDEARLFGRQRYQAVNISGEGSPFHEQ